MKNADVYNLAALRTKVFFFLSVQLTYNSDLRVLLIAFSRLWMLMRLSFVCRKALLMYYSIHRTKFSSRIWPFTCYYLLHEDITTNSNLLHKFTLVLFWFQFFSMTSASYYLWAKQFVASDNLKVGFLKILHK